ncbi:MAG: PaaX family transcriptional regulator C-terminal domain-containing protein [Sinimarinibacterium sp.]|jgi:phenylacetic acid degradation operon negative regulatory protein
MPPKARNLILDLLLASEGEALSARELIAGCGLFHISENTVRVALARLSAEGLIEAVERGSYQLSGRAHDLAGDVATWRTREQRLRPWQGHYLAVHTGALPRSDRGALRRRQRALDMLGFREAERGLHVRPDNIENGVATVRQRLYTVGLESSASVFVAHGFDPAHEARIRALWDGKALNALYRKQRAKLDAWMARAPSLDTDVAAREAFVLGSQAIRAVVFDPLLPEPFVDTTARHAFVDTVRRFDRVGQAIWRQGRIEALTPEPTTARRARAH